MPEDRLPEDRLRQLLTAYRSVVETLDIDSVPRRIMDAAASLVGASAGAIALFDRSGALENLIKVGSQRDADALSRALSSARLMPLDGVRRDAGAAGLSDDLGEGFLAVPIRSHQGAYGTLYLCRGERGAFSSEDEDLVGALAATAGIALENARMYEESRRRVRWSSALTEVSSALLSEDVTDVVGVVLARVGSVVEADMIAVVLPLPDTGELMIHTARGPGSEPLEGRRYERTGSLVDRALTGRQVVLADASPAQVAIDADLGPSMVLPVVVSGDPVCALTLSRAAGGARFTAGDVDMAAEFASQVGLAVELTRARADRQRLELTDERGRIARDLHDHVIQRLFGAALSLQGLAARFPQAAAGLQQQVDAIDAAIAEIRTAVFALSARTTSAADGTRHRLLDVATEMSGSLPATPRMTFGGAVDLLVTGELADDVVAVVRECLANAARHAQADQVSVDVSADDGEVVVTVIDDGVGISAAPARRSGTANLEERAGRHGGSFDVGPAEAGPDGSRGTRAVWRAPLDAERRRA
ncbi:GAF domain-containing protein [Microbacterium sp. NPDC096154]|uniref:GAF domain-containing sensor histidine kinase n=1 Tax=Microbacterium sp. NPDC096154 TaxID=3155549 RepID=UPI0033212911